MKLRRNTKRKRSRSGGNNGSYPPSAWGWQTANLGNGWQQFMNTFSINPADNLGTANSNEIVPMGRPNAEDSQPMIKPNMSGGRRGARRGRARTRGTRKRRGGNIVLDTIKRAFVPASLFTMRRYAVSNKERKRKSKK